MASSVQINENILKKLLPPAIKGHFKIDGKSLGGGCINSQESEQPLDIFTIKTFISNGKITGPAYCFVDSIPCYFDINANTNYLIDESSLLVIGCSYELIMDEDNTTHAQLWLANPSSAVTISIKCIPGKDLPTPNVSISDDILMIDLNTENEELLADTFEVYNNDIKIATVYADGTISM